MTDPEDVLLIYDDASPVLTLAEVALLLDMPAGLLVALHDQQQIPPDWIPRALGRAVAASGDRDICEIADDLRIQRIRRENNP